MHPDIIACHQPNFLPWLGYFAKIFHADVFFLLDDAQFTQGHNRHNWTTRVRILTDQGPSWLSIPVRRSGKGKQLIRDVQINTRDFRWIRKTLRRLEQGYGKTPCFSEYYPELKEIVLRKYTSIAELNIDSIEWLVEVLRIRVKILRSSEYSSDSRSNERLIDLTKSVGGKVYLSGDGADDYLLKEKFENNGIEIQKMGFEHPVYKQAHSSEFVPGLSIIDALFNIGSEATRDLLANSRQEQVG
jgi:hypothetical protein